ncbi:MAG: hypothetical protein WDN72_06575 [Alphaproteobacteria bacterium]
MPERIQLRSYDERPSSHLGIGGYLKRFAMQLLPFAIGGAGFVLARTWKDSWFAQPWLVGKEGAKELAAVAERTGQHVWLNGEGWGLKVGGVVLAYNLWHDKRKAQLDTDAIKKQILELKQFESADGYLTRGERAAAPAGRVPRPQR